MTDDIPPDHPEYWSSRYLSVNTPWDFDGVPGDLKEFLKRKDTGSNPQARGKVLIPGCGLGHDVRAWAAAGSALAPKSRPNPTSASGKF